MSKQLVCVTQCGETYCMWLPTVITRNDGTSIGWINDLVTTLYPEYVTQVLGNELLQILINEQEVASA